MRVSFGAFLLDSAERLLVRDGSAVHLTGKAFQLLVLLVAERPKIVSKKEIYDALWPNTYVQEANIKNLIAELRSAFGDGGEQWIRTERAAGYAFTAEVHDELAIAQPRFIAIVNGVSFPLRDGVNVIGRLSAAEIRLDSAEVSRRHASITVTGDDAVIQDLGSRNGTRLNGETLEVAKAIRPGDEIRIAQFAIRFQTAPGVLRPTAPLGYRL